MSLFKTSRGGKNSDLIHHSTIPSELAEYRADHR